MEGVLLAMDLQVPDATVLQKEYMQVPMGFRVSGVYCFKGQALFDRYPHGFTPLPHSKLAGDSINGGSRATHDALRLGDSCVNPLPLTLNTPPHMRV